MNADEHALARSKPAGAGDGKADGGNRTLNPGFTKAVLYR